MLDLLELRDQEQRAHTTQVQTDMNARWEELQQSIQTFISNHSQPHGSTSTSPPHNHGTNRMGFQVKDVNLDFPRFIGQDVLDWIFKAEQFFDYHNTPDEERVAIAAIHMDKLVVPWFQMIQ